MVFFYECNRQVYRNFKNWLTIHGCLKIFLYGGHTHTICMQFKETDIICQLKFYFPKKFLLRSLTSTNCSAIICKSISSVLSLCTCWVKYVNEPKIWGGAVPLFQHLWYCKCVSACSIIKSITIRVMEYYDIIVVSWYFLPWYIIFL